MSIYRCFDFDRVFVEIATFLKQPKTVASVNALIINYIPSDAPVGLSPSSDFSYPSAELLQK